MSKDLEAAWKGGRYVGLGQGEYLEEGSVEEIRDWAETVRLFSGLWLLLQVRLKIWNKGAISSGLQFKGLLYFVNR